MNWYLVHDFESNGNSLTHEDHFGNALREWHSRYLNLVYMPTEERQALPLHYDGVATESSHHKRMTIATLATIAARSRHTSKARNQIKTPAAADKALTVLPAIVTATA